MMLPRKKLKSKTSQSSLSALRIWTAF